MKEGYPSSLPPCPLSKYCLRFIDDLEVNLPPGGALSAVEVLQDERLLDQLRAHVPTCPTCKATLLRASRLRAQQRSSLRNLLLESEQYVPSTTARILSTIGSGSSSGRHIYESSNSQRDIFANTSTQPLPGIPESRPRKPLSSSSREPGVFWRNTFSLLAVAAILLAAIGLFSLLSRMRSSIGSPGQGPQYTGGWSAAVIGQLEGRQMSIVNYDLTSGRSTSLVKPFTADSTKIDGVSHDGHNLLYHFSSSGHTSYSTLSPLPNSTFFYELGDDNAGDALWMSDSRHVLIATKYSGIIEVDSQTGASRTIVSSLNAGHLWFYRDGYLYYDYTKNPPAFDLWRVNIASASIERVTKTFRGHSYFLSPDGTTVFYVDQLSENARGETAIYKINVNAGGEDAQILLQIDATPIGFATDNALELLQKQDGKFRLVKLQPTQPLVDRVVLEDAAPGAIALCDSTTMSFAPLCDENVALSPFGQGLIVTGLYADGSRKIWVDDLITGKQHVLQMLSSNTPHVQLPGWDRIPPG